MSQNVCEANKKWSKNFDFEIRFHLGVSLNGGTPKTPQNAHF